MPNPIVLEIHHTQTGERVEFRLPEEVGATMGHSRAMRYEIGLAAQWLDRAAKSERIEQHVRNLRELAQQILLEEEQNCGRIPDDIVAGARRALDATKGED